MNPKKVPGSRISSLIAMQLVGSSLVIGSGNEAKQDSWLTMLFAIAAAVPLLWLYASVLRLHPGKSFFDIAAEIFGSVGGKIFIGFYVFYAIYLGSQVFRTVGNFIKLVNLPNTPRIAIFALSVPLLAAQIRIGGMKNLSNCAKFLLPIILIFVISMFLLGLRFMNLDNIRPILGSNPADLARGTFRSLTLPLGEVVLCLPAFGEVNTKSKPFRVLLNGVLVGGGILVVALLRNLLILGSPVCSMYVFASYDAVGIISVGEFITRISVLIGINLVLASTAKAGTFIYTASQGMSRILGLKDLSVTAAPCTVLMATLSFLLYDNIVDGAKLLECIPVYSIFFQILLPLALLICGKIKQSRKRGAAAPAPAPRSFSEREREGADFFRAV